MSGSPLSILVPIHRLGWPFIAAFGVATTGLSLIDPALGWIGFVLTLWCVYFFRDPPRVTPNRRGLIVAPADGVVMLIERAPPPIELEIGAAPLTRISVFMNVFDVHVNRAPIGGRIAKIAYRPGRFFNAALDKASVDNERSSMLLDLDDGRRIAVVQIAGLVARRIVSFVKEGEQLGVGQRYGMIRFGSRVDVYLPDGIMPLVVEGQRAVAGETVLADLKSEEPTRSGVKS